MAEALGVDTDRTPERVAADVVAEVASIRDSLGLHSQLRDLPGVSRDELPTYADVILADRLMAYVPEGLDPTRESVLDVLESAW
jgi:alcohol dehydrogenase